MCVRVRALDASELKFPNLFFALQGLCVCARAAAGLDNLGGTCGTPEQLYGGHAVTQAFVATSDLVRSDLLVLFLS